ncbi:hypothetical protein ABZY36_01355 [Streptomyces sp. NPDC006627]
MEFQDEDAARPHPHPQRSKEHHGAGERGECGHVTGTGSGR